MSEHLSNETLSAFLDGELTDAGSAGRHLSTCPECSAALDRLAAASSGMGRLPVVRMTADEHRELRQALLRARPQRRGLRSGPVRWSLAGGVALLLVAVAGFSWLRSNDAGVDGTASRQESAAGGVLAFGDPSQVDTTVAGLPEVRALGGESDSSGSEFAGPGAAALSRGADGAGEAEGDDLAGSKAPAAQAGPDSAAPGTASAPEPPAVQTLPRTDLLEEMRDSDPAAEDPEIGATSGGTFSADAGSACLERIGATQSYDMVPLLAREASLAGEPAWLLVYAWAGPAAGPGAPLDQWQAWLVDPADCVSLQGPALARAALYRTFSTG